MKFRLLKSLSILFIILVFFSVSASAFFVSSEKIHVGKNFSFDAFFTGNFSPLTADNTPVKNYDDKKNVSVSLLVPKSGTHGHHSDPKFMGGDPKQELTNLQDFDHKNLHKELNDFLKTKTDDFGNHMRPQRGNPGAKIRENFTRTERINALREFYTRNADKYPEAAADFFKQHGR